jgi:hypothetical protein
MSETQAWEKRKTMLGVIGAGIGVLIPALLAVQWVFGIARDVAELQRISAEEHEELEEGIKKQAWILEQELKVLEAGIKQNLIDIVIIKERIK